MAKAKISKGNGNSKSKDDDSPLSMDELLLKYSGTPFALKRGNRVRGTVVEKEAKRILIDIGGKGEGVGAEKAFQEARDYIKTLNVGDEVEAMVIVGETPDGYTILSLRSAMQDAVWLKLEKAEREKTKLTVNVKSQSPSGLTVDVQGQFGFIPASQIGKELSNNINNLIGKNIQAIIIDLNRRENKIVLSEKEISEAEDIKLIAKATEKIKEGEIHEGKVQMVTNFGAFVTVEVPLGKDIIPVEGLVHISEISWGKIENINSVIKEGDKVSVRVMGKRDGKLSFSIKQAGEDPWTTAAKRFKKDEKYKGKIVRVSDYGIFVELEVGVEGLVHMTKIPPGMNFKVGDEINVTVEEIDTESKKIALGLVLTAVPVGYK